MRKLGRSVLTLFGLCYINLLTVFGSAGGPLTKPQPIEKEELRVEFESHLPDDFYRAFGDAVEWQKNNEPNKARAMYNTLLDSVREHKPSLYPHVRQFVVHNVRLLP